MWQIVQSEAKSAQELMGLDQEFLETLSEPTLHLYRFKNPSLTYGLLMKPEDHLHLDALEARNITLAQRPTGGGALFHLWDLAFSLIIPLKYICHIKGTLERYSILNQMTLKALRPFLDEGLKKDFLQKTPEHGPGDRFCMAKPTQFDVMIEDKKCVGAAQRVTKKNLLHQATISLCAPDIDLLNEVLIDPKVPLAMKSSSYNLFNFSYKDKALLLQKQSLIEAALEKTFQDEFDPLFSPS
jgi:lipoate-protein ligase A